MTKVSWLFCCCYLCSQNSDFQNVLDTSLYLNQVREISYLGSTSKARMLDALSIIFLTPVVVTLSCA